MVFGTEILEICYPTRYFVKEASRIALPLSQLLDKARRQLPDSLPIQGVRISSDLERAYQLILPNKKETAFIDPYTGQITGIDDGKSFFLQTMRLHRWLLDSYK